MARTQFERKGVLDSGAKILDAQGNTLLSGQSAGDGANGYTSLSDVPMLFNGSTYDRLRSAKNNGSNNNGIGFISGHSYLWNGIAYDQYQNNTQGILLASLARTAYTASPTQTNYNARGVVIYLNVTTASGTGGLSVYINGLDPVTSAVWGLNATPTVVTATGEYIYILYPSANGTVGTSIRQLTSIPLPRSWRCDVGVGDASSYTYSLGYSYIL